MKSKTHFLSFVEECIMDPAYKGYIGGRIEVYEIGSEKYAIEEIRFFTKKLKEYHRLRGRYDFEDVTEKGLERLKKKIIALFLPTGDVMDALQKKIVALNEKEGE